MNLVSRSQFPTLSEKTKNAIMIGTARANRVVYLIGAEIDQEQHFLLSKGDAKGFKFVETAAKALNDAGFEDFTLSLDESAQALLAHEQETLAFLAEVFSEFGSMRAFANQHSLDYDDVLGVVTNGRRLRPVQLAIAQHVGKDPVTLWPDFNEPRK